MAQPAKIGEQLSNSPRRCREHRNGKLYSSFPYLLGTSRKYKGVSPDDRSSYQMLLFPGFLSLSSKSSNQIFPTLFNRSSPSTHSRMSESEQNWVYYPITGVPVKADHLGPNVAVPIRQNIDTWSRDPANDKQVKLFVMALDQFQKIDPSVRDSYFQIAGIHGQPNVPWDEPISKDDAANQGYCTHNNILFPIWHRAYLALYEVSLPELRNPGENPLTLA